MDFIKDYIFIIIIVASALAQWWKSTQEAKKERENPYQPDSHIPRELEDLLEQVERKHPRPAVPPPLPRGANPVPPSFDRSPVPALKKANRPTSEAKAFVNAPHYQEEALQAELARQAAIAEQLSGLKQAKKKQEVLLTAKREKAKTVVYGSIRDRLKNRSELRQAFVLKEFLDKPVGLR
ncbi:MAG: hypothetical protein V4727_00110 [Verrucomicrobiota bacterium]